MLLGSRFSIGIRLLGFAIFSSSCGGDDATAAVPQADSSIYISALRSSAGAAWSRSSPDDLTPAELELPCDGRLVASLVLANFSARAPGACGATQQCGHVKVTLVSDANSEWNVETRAVLGPVLLELAEPEKFVGGATLTARLLLDDGSDYLSASGTPVSSSLAAGFRLVEGCPERLP